jgi:hypothetical protein
LGRLQRAGRGDARFRVEALAQWWTQAQDRERYGLVQRLQGQTAPQKGDPTLAELRIAIVCAELSAGESEIR